MEADVPALKITQGVHKGAVIRLSTADMLVIGSSEDCDVILADSGVSSHHCVLKKQDGQFFLRAIEGAFSLGGQPHDPGATTLVPLSAAVLIGGAAFEIASISSIQEPVVDSAQAEQSPAEGSPREPSGLTGSIWQLARRRPVGAIAIAVVLVTSLVAAGAVSVAMNGRSVNRNSEQTASVNTTATRSGVAIAHDVAEVLRLSGINCEARYNGDGQVTVSGHLGEPQALAAIINSRAIREIVGLKRVMALNLDQNGRSAKGSVVDGTRIVSVVASADPYVVTADGSRYYVGASLPQGGRLAGVKEGEVLVERDGRTEHWKIADPNRGSGEFRPTTQLR